MARSWQASFADCCGATFKHTLPLEETAHQTLRRPISNATLFSSAGPSAKSTECFDYQHLEQCKQQLLDYITIE